VQVASSLGRKKFLWGSVQEIERIEPPTLFIMENLIYWQLYTGILANICVIFGCMFYFAFKGW
tara:strand:+ start:695 stop:883 length:189 start_codon:yes stop_codon:yes gene_type:complete